jgi:hypothetical protein
MLDTGSARSDSLAVVLIALSRSSPFRLEQAFFFLLGLGLWIKLCPQTENQKPKINFLLTSFFSTSA